MRKLAIVSAVLLAACTDIPDQPDPATHASPGTLSWYLPKMTVSVDVSYMLTACPVDGSKLPTVQIADEAITPKPVPDLSQRHSLVVANLAGWRTSNMVSVSLYDDLILKSLGANPQDQTATIMGNVVKSAAQVAGLALRVPVTIKLAPAGPNTKYGCTATAAKALADLQTLRAKLLDPSVSTSDATNVSATISRLQAVLTYKKSVTVDTDHAPPWTALAPQTISLTVADMRGGAHWLNPAGVDDDATLAAPDVVTLTWTHTGELPAGPAPAVTDFDYREPLMATLTLALKVEPKQVLMSRDIAFAQWGTPRSLPITVPVFETLDWSYTFAEDGTPTDAKVTTTARGLAASSLLNSATSTAGSAMTAAKSAATANSELTKLQNQDALLKAKTAVITDTNALVAAGGSP
jgi:hypothetical protein